MLAKQEQLTADELAVIQSRYGLDLSASTIPDIDAEELDRLETSALRKLRHQTLESLPSWRQAV